MMKFTRLSDNDIKCVISEDELVDYGIDLDDIIEKKGRTKEFFRQLLDMAAEKLGMSKTEGMQMASAQISVLKDNSISIVFHETSVEDALRRITGGDRLKMEKLKKDIEAQVHENPEKLSNTIKREIVNAMEEQLKAEGNYSPEVVAELDQIKNELNAAAEEDEGRNRSAVIAFNGIDEAIKFCKVTGSSCSIVSSLFRNRKDGFYYLFILKGDMDSAEFSRILFAATEYGRTREYSNAEKAFLISVSDVLIREQAYSKLQKIE